MDVRIMLIGMALAAGGPPAQAQTVTWPPGPQDATIQAERMRLERERWRSALELRALQADLERQRTEAVVADIRARRGPPFRPEAPVLQDAPYRASSFADPVASEARREALQAGLSGIDAFLDRTRPD